MTVQIEGERIASITKGQGAATPRDAFDGTGLYVIPGLWDMHVHAFWTPLNPDRMFPLFLANGVTGIRDLGSPLDFEQLRVLRAKFDNAPLAPRIVMAGKLVDGDPPIWPGSLIAAKAEQAETAVRALRDAGADVVKLYSRLSRDGYIAVIHASQAAGLPTVGHVPISISAWDAAREGQHSIEHLSELLLACSFEEATLRQELLDAPPGKARDAIRRTQVRKLVETFDQKKAAALSEEFRKRAVWQVPTLLAQRAYAYPPSKGFSAEPWARYVTPETLAGYTKRLESFRQGKTPKELEWQERSYDGRRGRGIPGGH
jgi:hypothetical protein